MTYKIYLDHLGEKYFGISDDIYSGYRIQIAQKIRNREYQGYVTDILGVNPLYFFSDMSEEKVRLSLIDYIDTYLVGDSNEIT